MTQDSEPTRTLDQLPPGQSSRIRRVGGSGPLRRRLLDMGMTRGAEVELVRVAPLGDPIQICLRGYNLALRRSEARLIEIDL